MNNPSPTFRLHLVNRPTMPTTEPNVLPPAEVARLKGVSRQAVSTAADRGTLNAVRIGKAVLILRDAALDAYLSRPPQPGGSAED